MKLEEINEWEHLYEIVHSGLVKDRLPKGTEIVIGANAYVVKDHNNKGHVFSITLECLTENWEECEEKFGALVEQGVIEGYELKYPRSMGGYKNSQLRDFLNEKNTESWWVGK